MARPKRKKFNFDNLDQVKQELENSKIWTEERDKEIELRFSLQPMNNKQQQYINAIETSVLTFASGPSGTAKTYIACWMAIKLLKEEKIEKIILTRPALECGEKIGFLPGTIEDKLYGYLFPLIDALSEFIGEKTLHQLMKKDIIRLSAVAQMRGSSFKKSVIIIDEAQNLTFSQLKMLVTRIGRDCRMIVCGDTKQSDLYNKDTDLNKFFNKLKSIEDIAYINFTKEEIVRSGIVKRILDILE